MAFVNIRRSPRDWKTATVSLDSLDGFHFATVSGGAYARSARPFLAAFVRCDAIVEGEVGHSCTHGPAPHSIKVAIVARDNSRELVRELRRRAEASRAE